MTFNRTIVELKPRIPKLAINRRQLFNRTIVELKQKVSKHAELSECAFNRTIVELKHLPHLLDSFVIQPLDRTIVGIETTDKVLVSSFTRYF